MTRAGRVEAQATLARARALDERDPLAPFRERFEIPDPDLAYLDGNSLGRPPAATLERLGRVLSGAWAGGLIRSWEREWLDLPLRLGDLLGTGLLGAQAGEVLVCDNTTVNLYKVASAALGARPGRRAIVTDRGNFPTDRYVLEGLAAQADLEIRWLDPDPVEGPQPGEVEAALDGDVAFVELSHVDYRSAAIADVPRITGLAHAAGALAIWDLCHSVGAVHVDLTGDGVDLAVGCTYKYLNGGPGAPAFVYVRRDLQPALRQPIWGWWARREMFEMAEGFDPVPDVRSYLTGTPPILSMAAIEDGVGMLLEAGMDALRAKGVALTGYAVSLFDAWLTGRGFALGSPRSAERRGSHVLIRHPDGQRLARALIDGGVIVDFRRPDGIRVGLAPLTTRFVDVHRAMRALADLAPA